MCCCVCPTQGWWSSTWQRQPASSGPWLRALPNSQYALQQKQCLSGKMTAPVCSMLYRQCLQTIIWWRAKDFLSIKNFSKKKKNHKPSAEWKHRTFDAKQIYKAINLNQFSSGTAPVFEGEMHCVPVSWTSNTVPNQQLEFNVLMQSVADKKGLKSNQILFGNLIVSEMSVLKSCIVFGNMLNHWQKVLQCPVQTVSKMTECSKRSAALLWKDFVLNDADPHWLHSSSKPQVQVPTEAWFWKAT